VIAAPEALETARSLHAEGRKVVAIVGWRVPREPLLAAKVHAVQITPALGQPTPIADELLSSESAPDIRALFETIVGGTLDFADLVVIAPPFAGLSIAIEDLRRAGLLREQTPPAYFFEVLAYRETESRAFMTARIRDLIARIESLGTVISNAGLIRAIHRCNLERREVARLLEARSRIAGSHAITTIAAGASMEPEPHIAILQGGHAAVAEDAPTMLIVSSSVLYDDRLHRIVESCGAHVLGEDDINGSCYAFGEVAESVDPIEALGGFYFENQPPQHTSPTQARLRWIFDRGFSPDVDGVIFYAEDPSWGWDLPALRATLEASGKKTLLLANDVRTREGADAASQLLNVFLQGSGKGAAE
jgi:benzoyl-CoA reductase/2-hydroxyglutaryl-CoA dehydratase subunit BcrC/BadD/HgdB